MAETNSSESELLAELNVLRTSEERYRMIFEQTAEAMALIDAKTNEFVEFNRQAHENLGYTRKEFKKLRATDLETKPSSKELSRHIERVFKRGSDDIETSHRTKAGDERKMHATVKLLSIGGKDYFLTMWRDITEQKQVEESMYALSLVDELTGLYNRRGFLALAEQQRKMVERFKKDMFLVFADVDRLKAVNDTIGHAQGDMLLIDTATALRKTFRSSDITARIGGDEFASLLLQVEDVSPEVIRTRLNERISAINAQRKDYQLSLSVGIIHYDAEKPRKLHELLHEADQAMYEEKRAKKNARNRPE